MATNIPPHNLKEVVEAAIVLIEEPEANLKKIMKLVPGPDFPTAGYIYGREGIEQAYKTGRGSFQVRAKVAIEQRGKDRQDIVVTELPYQVNKARLIENIAGLIQNKKIEGIADIRDESDRDGMRIVIEVKRDEEPQIILAHLFKHTQMQESFSMILLAIVAGQPRELGLLDLLRLFIEHRVDVVRRRTQYELRKARRARAHFARLSALRSTISTTSSRSSADRPAAPTLAKICTTSSATKTFACWSAAKSALSRASRSITRNTASSHSLAT